MGRANAVFGAERIERVKTYLDTHMYSQIKGAEIQRRKRVGMAKWQIGIGILLVLPGIWLMFHLIFVRHSDVGDAALFLMSLINTAGLILIIYGCIWSEELRRDVKYALVQPVIEQLGFAYTAWPSRGMRGAQLAFELGLIPKHDGMAGEDQITGTRSGLTFEFIETQLTEQKKEKGRTTNVQVFWGQCITINFDKSFDGVTIAARKSDRLFWRRRPKGLQKARLESSVILRKFQMYTSDQVEARYLMTPDLLERLETLEKRIHGKKLRFGFKGTSLVIVVQKGNLFDPPRRRYAYDSDKVLGIVLDDMAALIDLLDTLAARHHRETIS